MATTFDPNRVGPGTFQLVRDASTGTYSIQEVGFTKLPSLTLPDLTPTTTTTTTTTQTQDQTKTDTTDVSQPILPQVGGGGDKQDFTSFILKTPDDQIDQATQISQNLNNQFLASGAAGGASLQVDENKIDRGNPTGDSRIVSEEQGLVGGRVPDAIRTGQPAIGMGVPDAVKFGQPTLPDTKITNIIGKTQDTINTAKDIISNKKPVQLLGLGVRMVATALENALVSPQQQALNRSNKNALSAVGYKTRGELGGSTDPGRIAGNPADNVFAGMNAQSARGNIMTASKNRIDKIRASAAKTTDKAKAARLNAKADKFEKQRQQVLDKKEEQQAKINKATMNQGPPSQSGGGNKSGGKIVCTMMNESYGFGSFRNKIWLRQSKNLAPEYQIGYHKLFLPLVNYAKQKGITNNVVKKILEHIAIHRTIDIRQEEKNKIHLIGRVYRKILEPLCYWAGKK